MPKAIIDGVTIITDFDAEPQELKNYLEFVEMRVDVPVNKILVTLCDDGLVDVSYIARGEPFERIRRITG